MTDPDLAGFLRSCGNLWFLQQSAVFCGFLQPRKILKKIRGKFGAKFGANSGRKFEKFGELSFCNFSDVIKRGKAKTSRGEPGNRQGRGFDEGGDAHDVVFRACEGVTVLLLILLAISIQSLSVSPPGSEGL